MKVFAILLMIKTVFSAPINPDENRDIEDPNLFEGDMLLTPLQRAYAMMGLDVYSSNKQGASIRSPLWPGGVLIYEISPTLANRPEAMTSILAGMDEWSRKTCIRFRKRTTETDYAYFTFGSGCRSWVGKIGSRQDISLGFGCWDRGIVAHEIGHALGYLHEQSRPDRDQYVTILKDNIKPGEEHNFFKYDNSLIDSLGTRYDYESVMHYSQDAFSRNGLPTILVKKEGYQDIIGQREGLSLIDAEQANKLYKQCGVAGGVKATTPPAVTGIPTTITNQQT
ncbi:zinc metalloproteinase nas-14-like [Porites lutea]|uniref:zinc metalloproteinase nas-14-like n=1 Tax=Porites lutea TaxID=51062 RepID=UPI003CC66664